MRVKNLSKWGFLELENTQKSMDFLICYFMLSAMSTIHGDMTIPAFTQSQRLFDTSKSI